MRKIFTIALGGLLIAASSVQMAAATEHHHHARKVIRAPTSEQWEQFRGARNSPVWQKENLSVNGGNA
jgi:hypothetical protein